MARKVLSFTQEDVDYAVSVAVSFERNRTQRLVDELRGAANAARAEKSELTLRDGDEVARFHRLDGIAEAYELVIVQVLDLSTDEVIAADTETAEQS